MSSKPIPNAEIGSKWGRLPAFRQNDLSRSISSKLVEGMYSTSMSHDSNRNKDGNITPPSTLVAHVANKTAANVVDAENMMQLLPDMELAKQVLVSSILSPVDMISTELTWSSTADALADVKAPMLDVVKDYFENSYKITPKLSTWLEEILFTKGAYPVAVLPESSIDYAINSNSRVTTESLKDELDTHGRPISYGILGNPGTQGGAAFGLESLSNEAVVAYNPTVSKEGVANLYLDVTDNISVLKFPKLFERIREDRVNAAYGRRSVGMESDRRRDKEHDNPTTGSVYPARNFSYTPVVKIRTLDELDKETVGHPLVFDPPVESVIPVHVPGSPDKHIGYFVVVDRHGNPVRAISSQDFYADLAYNASNMREMSSQLLSQARRATEGRRQLNDLQMFDEGSAVYTEIVESDLISRLKNGLLGENFQLAKPVEIYRMMFARACARMNTQLIYVPASLMTYMAFDYNEVGAGKSLLEATKVLGSIRAMTLFSNTMAGIKNSINHVGLNIELDPNDPDPDATVEILLTEYAKTRQAAYPIGASNPLDIISYLQNAGVEVATSGHPKYPETKVGIENKNANWGKVDTELDESLKKKHLMSFGVAPETVELSMGADFATSIVNSNILLAKRSIVYQDMFCPFISDHVQKYTLNSAILRQRLRDVLEANADKLQTKDKEKLDMDKVIDYFIRSIVVALPRPDLKRLEVQMIAFENYSTALDKVLPAFISGDMFDNSTMGDASNQISVTVAILKAYYQRRWLEENGVMTEMFDMVVSGDKERGAFDLLEQHETYMRSIGDSIYAFMTKASKYAAVQTKAMGDLTNKYGSDMGSGGGGSDEGSGDNEGGGEGEGSGSDDGDFDMDALGGDEGGEAGGEGGTEGGEESGGDTGDFDMEGAAEAAGDKTGGEEATGVAEAKPEKEADTGDFDAEGAKETAKKEGGV